MEPFHSHRRGFTLVELVVALAIIGVIMAIVLTSQSSFNKTFILQNAAYDIALTLRDAEVYGLGSRAVGITANAGYGVHFQDVPTRSFTFFADTYPPPNASNCHGLPTGGAAAINAQPGNCIYTGQDQKVTDYTLGNGLTVKDFCTYTGTTWSCAVANHLSSLDIVFARPNPDAFITADGSRYSAACLTITSPQSPLGGERYVSVAASGAITANATSCSGSEGGGGSCTPNCHGRVCGSDGCSGSCGSCSGSQSCVAGSCVTSCIPNCTGKVCGDNGCEGSCGSCSGSQSCVAGACIENPPTFSATGGTVTYSGGYTIHTFTSSGTFTVTGSGSVDVLVVAGGGPGPAMDNASSGGGGAGGVIYNTNFAVSSGAITVTVGNGGSNNLNGENSVFSSLTATGGGRGGGYNYSGGYGAGMTGGSGGGGGYYQQSPYGEGIAGQGNNGGRGYASGNTNAGAGGGGKGSAGSDVPSPNTGGNGGTGQAYSISGASVMYAGGGGGCGLNAGGSGGSGIGGTGGTGLWGSGVTSGAVNTGSGGGGGGYTSSSGGSGIVIVRYPTP